MVVYETLWLVAVSVIAAVAVHEGGHLLGALATGQRPRVLVFGHGPAILRLRGRTFAVVLRAVPVTGYVLVEPTDRRVAFAAMVAAGPLANILALAGCLRAHALWPDAGLAVALAIYQGLFAAATLVPARGRVAGIRLPSDGAQLYRLLRHRRVPPVAAGYASLMGTVEPQGAPARAPTRHAARLVFDLGRPDQFVDPHARRDAFASLRASLGEADLMRPERALTLCVLCAWEFIYGDAMASARELDAWSREALALTREPVGLDTRGAVLLMAGRRQEAEGLLRDALDGYAERHGAESPQAALCRGLLARAVDPAGRADEARALWRQAEAAPAISADPRLRTMLTRIKAKPLPAEDGPGQDHPAPSRFPGPVGLDRTGCAPPS